MSLIEKMYKRIKSVWSHFLIMILLCIQMFNPATDLLNSLDENKPRRTGVTLHPF